MSPSNPRQPGWTCPACNSWNESTNSRCRNCQASGAMYDLTPTGSPFDAIRRVDEHGEFWTGRALQPLMDYARWQTFQEVIEKAKASLALVEGQASADKAFVQVNQVTQVGNLGDKAKGDYRLTRFGAYLAAMAGDDTKEAVAHARVYFAVRAREAEVSGEIPHIAEGEELDLLEQQTERTQQAIAIARTERRRADHFEKRATVAEGTVRQIEGANGLTLRMFHKKYFSEVREREFFEHLYTKGYLIDQRGKGSTRPDGTVRDGSEHRHPSFKGKPYLYLHFNGVHGDQRRETTRVRPGQPELDFKAALVHDGLRANGNDDGFLFGIGGGS